LPKDKEKTVDLGEEFLDSLGGGNPDAISSITIFITKVLQTN